MQNYSISGVKFCLTRISKDVDTIHSSDEVEGVAVKRYDLHSLPTAAAVDSSAAFTALRYKTWIFANFPKIYDYFD